MTAFFDGPFSIQDLSKPTTTTVGGFEVTTYPLAPGEHYKTDPDTFEGFADLLAPYLVSPSPLQNVWAGDDPAAPVLTVPLRFGTKAEADAARLAILGPAVDA